jgi:tetratricopeptide (TPR) repeat protein
LFEAIAAKGADSAVALYRDLRSRYYGRAAYDFGENAIPAMLPMPDQRPAALALLKLNLEFYPQSVPTMQGLAQVSLQAGDTAAALDWLNQAIALAPNDRQLQGMLNRIKGGRPNPGW